MRVLLGALALFALSAAAAGCGADKDPCTGWTYGGCCGLGGRAQFIRTCINPDGTERTETQCSGTCGGP
jgi:hypothetical protein